MVARAKRLLYRGGMGIGAVLLAAYFLFQLAEPSEVLAATTAVSIPEYAVAFGLYYVTIPIRTERWRALMTDTGVKIPRGWANEVVFLSLYFNTVLPAKAGDIYRAHHAGTEWEVPRSTALGTIGAERVFDLLVLIGGLLVSLLLVSQQFVDDQQQLVVLVVGVFISLLAGSGLIILLPHLWLPEFIRQTAVDFRRGFTAVSTVNGLVFFTLTTIAIWVCNVFRLWAIAGAVDMSLGVPKIVFVALLISLLAGLPYTPAGVGLVEIAGSSVLVFLGASGSAGVSFILLDRFITVGSTLIVGTVVYIVVRLGIRKRSDTDDTDI